VRRHVVLCAVVIFMVGCQTTLIGSVGPPWPGGLHSRQGDCLGSPTCAFSVGELIDERDYPRYIYGGSRHEGGSPGTARFAITDVIRYPSLLGGQYWERAACRRSTIDDPTLMAVVERSGEVWLRAQNWAYRFDVHSGKFVKVDPVEVDCYNTALGAD